jgi:molecular chaperone HscB
MICWNCREPVQGAVCPGCDKLQPPPAVDHFELLRLPRKWSLDKKTVDLAWRKLARQTHPDRFVGRRAVERRMAQQWTARAMDAKAILRDPHRRALYLATGEPDLPEQGGPEVGADFLETVFELQMSARMQEPDVGAQVEALVHAQETALSSRLEQWESGDGSLDEVPALIARLRYLRTARGLVAELTT